jgi:hypothetical protein
MSANTVCRVKTVQFDSPAGLVGVVLITVDAGDPVGARGLVRSVADKFKLQRLSSPLRTETLLVTITGELTAHCFARLWRELAMEDATLALIMSQMCRAEVAQTNAARAVCATASLLPESAPEFLEPHTPACRQPERPDDRDGTRSTISALLAESVPA